MNAIPTRPISADVAQVKSAARSHVGLVRAINEDRVFDCADAGLWAIADGMGGHRGGDLAAQAVIDALRRLVQSDTSISPATVAAALADANDAIIRRNRELKLDAGSTVVVAMMAGDEVTIGWAGDSRAYRLRERGAELVTEDHSVVQELVAAGVLTPDMAERHPQANVITRALGVNETVALDWVTVTLNPGERLLLCSDGLSRSFRGGSFTRSPTVDVDADLLLADALRRDGSDNISLVVVDPGRP